MKTSLPKWFAFLMVTLVINNVQAQLTQIVASPAQNDFCSYVPITLSVSPYDPTHTYNWVYINNSQFSTTGQSLTSPVFSGTGSSIMVNPCDYESCTTYAIEELDANGNPVFSSIQPYTIGCSFGVGVPIYYDNCQSIYVPSAYSNYPWFSGRWAMWYRNGVATGEQSPQFLNPAAGNYQYKLKLVCGDTVYSQIIPIAAVIAPVITASGASTVCMGDTVTLSFQSGFLYPRWYKDGVQVAYNTPVFKAIQSGTYTVNASLQGSNNCTLWSNQFIVTVQSGAFITSTDTAKCGGDSIKLNCTSATTYSWKKDGVVIPASNTQSIYAKVSGTYQVLTSGLTCNTSKTKHIGIYNYPVVTTTPTGTVSLCTGAGLNLTASGTNSNSYQWYKSNVAIVGGNTASVYIPKSGIYKCTVANLIGCSTTSANITVTAAATNTLPTKTITLQPSAVGIDSWVTSDFFGQNSNYGSGTFMELSNWYKYFRTADRGLLKFDLSSIPTGSPILTASMRLYIDTVKAWTNAGQTLLIKRITQPWAENTVTFNTQPATTDYLGLTIAQSLIASHTYINSNVLDLVNYWVNNTGDNNGVKLLSNESNVTNLGWLRIASSDNANSSQRPRLIVKYVYAKMDTSGATTFCTGDSVTLTTNTGAFTFQWYKNNVAIVGATTATYVAKTTGNYYVIITAASGCSVKSVIKSIVVVAKPLATTTALGPLSFCNGDSVKLQANAGTGFTYQWLKNNVDITNATNVVYTAKTAGTYRVRVTNSTGCSTLSATKTVAVPCREGEKIEDVDVEIYPNPFNTHFTISTTAENAIENVRVFDVSGKLIEEHLQLLSGSQMGANWNKGVYIIEVNGGDSKCYNRVVKL